MNDYHVLDGKITVFSSGIRHENASKDVLSKLCDDIHKYFSALSFLFGFHFVKFSYTKEFKWALNLFVLHI
jgi:hypothetical protein